MGARGAFLPISRLPGLCLVCWCIVAAAARAEPPRVVASIVPIHSLVAAVMQGVDEPVLLVAGKASPHDYTLRPSEARSLSEAALVFRVGGVLEAFLDKPLASLGDGTRVVELAGAPGVTLLESRNDGRWGLPQEAGGHGHEHGPADPHIWLSPANAAAMVRAISLELAGVDAANAGRYASNAEHTLHRVAESEQRWRQRLAPVRDAPYVVAHDAYQYLERHFGLNAVGAIALAPGTQPSAKHVRSLLETMRSSGAVCLFREPQFRSGLVQTLLEGSGARAALLDPVGTTVTPGPEAWFELMDANVESLASCLSGR